MKFVLFEKLAELSGKELIMFIAAAVVAVALIVLLVSLRKRSAEAEPARRIDNARAHLWRAVLEPFLCAQLHQAVLHAHGRLAHALLAPAHHHVCLGVRPGLRLHRAFAYSLLQIIQGAWIVHPVQFVLDYFVAFTCYGLASLFPKCLPLGVGVAGLARYAASVISGVVFFADSAVEAGYESALVYSLGYNGATIGIETVLCVIVACLPGVARIAKEMNKKRA